MSDDKKQDRARFLRSLPLADLLRHVDRSNPDVAALCAKIENEGPDLTAGIFGSDGLDEMYDA